VQSKGVKPKFIGRKSRRVVYWQGASKQEDRRETSWEKKEGYVSQGEIRIAKRLAAELDGDGVCRRFCSIGTANALPRKLLKGFEISE
jgi:hypothetical protein